MISLSLYYLSCESKNDNEERLNNILFPSLDFPGELDCGEVILANGIDPDYPVMDPYNIKSIELNGDILNIETEYSGGCKEHSFCLIAWSYFLESYPVQANLLLSHNDNDDYCDAVLTSHLSIDLSPLKNNYTKLYEEGDSLLLNIKISSGDDISLLYKF